MAYLEISHLNFSYAGTTEAVLKDLSFSIEKSSFVLICGASGSGKSTLLKMLKPQLTPKGNQKGSILLNQEPLHQLSKNVTACKIGYVMQDPENQIVTTSVWHELAFGLENLGISATEMQSRIAEITHFLGIQTLVDCPIQELSGGQKQLINLAAILVMHPDILILDEPTAQLDPLASQMFLDILVRLHREMGLTILLAEHSLEATLHLADQVLLLDQGDLLLDEPPRRILDSFAVTSQSIQRFMFNLPSATRIYHGLGLQGTCPFSVLEGQKVLATYFQKKQTLQTKPASTSVAKLSKKNAAVQLKNCWFRYEKNGVDVLAGLDLVLNYGEIVSIVGGNGCGKSTLLKMIAGILNCYQGKIYLEGQPINKYQQLIGYLPQNPKLLFIKETVLEEYQQYADKFLEEETEQRVDKIVAELKLESYLFRHPLDLSGGEYQRIALGKILLASPQILLLDEPTKGLDNYDKQEFIDLLRRLSQQGKAILLVTHDLEFAAEVSDYCGLFFKNNLLSIEKPQNFFQKHIFYTTAASRISRDFFDDTVTVDQVIQAGNKELGR